MEPAKQRVVKSNLLVLYIHICTSSNILNTTQLWAQNLIYNIYGNSYIKDALKISNGNHRNFLLPNE